MKILFVRFYLIALLLLFSTSINGETSASDKRQNTYSKLVWTQCDTTPSAMEIVKFDVSPMPMLHPGYHDVDFEAHILRETIGNWRTEINIIRTINGLTLPVRCYLTQGIFMGSCNYTDFCSFIEIFIDDAEENGPILTFLSVLFGFSTSEDFKCPMTMEPNHVEVNKRVLIPDLSKTVMNFMSTGDFNVTIKSRDNVGSLICLNMKYSLKPAPSSG